jgi:hypothetical protein
MRQLDRQIAWPQVMDAFDREGQSDAFRVACMMWRRLLPPGPAIPVDRPRWAGLYWRRCMLDVRKPEWLFMRERLGVNAGLMRRMFSPTPEGKELRRTLVTPSVFLRKLRAAAQLVGGGKWR